MPKKRTKHLAAKDLKPGLRFRYSGADVEILRDRVSDRDRFGLPLERWWSRNLGTGEEGYVSLGPGGTLGPVEILAKKRSKTVVSAKRPIGWTVTDPARPGWSETGTSTFDEEGRVHVQKRGEQQAKKKKSPARLQRDIDEALKKPSRLSHAKMGRHGYENGQRVVVLDYLGDEIGRGRVRSGDNYPESNEHFTWVTMTRDGETVTKEHPTRRVVLAR